MKTDVVGWFTADPYQTSAVVVGVLLALTVALVTIRKLPHPLEGIGPQAVVALGGVAVSVHGLWGFASEFAGLPPVLAVGFICVFDAAELVLLVMLYRTADPEVGWTRELRQMHRTAWMLVCFSAAMNAVHAPTWWGRPVLGAIPALAAWLIELKLRAKLADGGQEQEDIGRPGPARLVLLAWQHLWSWLFAVLGLDAADRGSDIAKAALAQRAARAVYRLRLALEAREHLPVYTRQGKRNRVEARTARRRRTAQRALDRADIGTDTGQALALARRMAALTGVDGVALTTYSDAQRVMDMLEGLAVVPAAQRITASTRAMEAEAARERAEDARQIAEAARQRAEEETSAAREDLQRLNAERAEAEEAAEQAAEAAATARREAQRAEDARQEAEAARQRAADDAGLAEHRARELRGEADLAKDRLERTEDTIRRLEEQAGTARQDQHGTQDQLAALRRELADLQAARTKAQAEYTEAATTAAAARQDLDDLTAALRQNKQAAEQAQDNRRVAEQAARQAAEQAAAQQNEAREITALLERLRGDLAEHIGDGATPSADGRLFESDAKQAGYEHYRAQTRAGNPAPRAAELAARFGVSEGNARNWLRDFRAAHARQLAAPAARTESAGDARIPA